MTIVYTKVTKIQRSPVFTFCSVGKYVCHHAVLTRDHGYYVGAKRFTTIGDVVDYFTDHPLGETTLKQEVRCEIISVQGLVNCANNVVYCMAGSTSSKMKWILSSDRLPEQARLSHLARFVRAKAKSFDVNLWPCNKSFIDQTCSVRMFFLRFYGPQSTSPQCIKTQKRT